MDVRQTNLGDLVDDFEGEKVKLKRYEERVVTLEQLNNDKNMQVSLTHFLNWVRTLLQ